MNYTLNLHGERRVPIPNGLPELISDISKEVLHNQPTNLVLFIAQYLTAKYRAREKAKGMTDFIDEILREAKHNILDTDKYGLTQPVAHDAAKKIQALYKGYKVRKSFKEHKTSVIRRSHQISGQSDSFMTRLKGSYQESRLDSVSIKYIKRSVNSIPESIIYDTPSQLRFSQTNILWEADSTLVLDHTGYSSETLTSKTSPAIKRNVLNLQRLTDSLSSTMDSKDLIVQTEKHDETMESKDLIVQKEMHDEIMESEDLLVLKEMHDKSLQKDFTNEQLQNELEMNILTKEQQNELEIKDVTNEPQNESEIKDVTDEPQNESEIKDVTNEPQNESENKEVTNEPQNELEIKDVINETQNESENKDVTNESENKDVTKEPQNESENKDVTNEPQNESENKNATNEPQNESENKDVTNEPQKESPEPDLLE